MGRYIVIVFYYDMTPTDSHSYTDKLKGRLAARILLYLMFVLIICLALSVALFVLYVDQDDRVYEGYAYALGLTSSILIAVVWFPQIWTTWKKKVRSTFQPSCLCPSSRLAAIQQAFKLPPLPNNNQDIGALSIGMLLIQMPGNLLVVFFQAVLSKKNWTTWTPYVLFCAQQGVLIGMWVWFWHLDRKKRRAKVVYEEDGTSSNEASLSPMAVERRSLLLNPGPRDIISDEEYSVNWKPMGV